MNTTETSLRVRFAKAMGWTDISEQGYDWWREKCGGPIGWSGRRPNGGSYIESIPEIDANTVHEALMGMTDLEWEKFCGLLAEKLGYGNGTEYVIKQTLKVEPTTLAEFICQVRNV